MAIAVPAGTHTFEWHEERLQGIGGSDAPIVLGLSSFMSGAELSLQKIRQEIRDESSPTERDLRRRLGNMLEPVLGDLYRETKRRPLRASHLTLWGECGGAPTFAHADGFAPRTQNENEPDDAERVLIEMKTRDFEAGGWGEPDGGWLADDSDRIPRDVLAQVQHNLAVTRLRVAHVVVLFGLRKFRVYRIPASPTWRETFEAVYPEFWRIVEEGRSAIERGEEPVLWPVDGSPASAEFVKRRYPHGEPGRTILPTNEQEKILLDCARANAAFTAAKKTFEGLKAQVQDFMQDAVACSSGAASASWSPEGEPGSKVDFEKLAAAYRALLVEHECVTIDEIERECTEATAGASRRFTVKLAKGQE